MNWISNDLSQLLVDAQSVVITNSKQFSIPVSEIKKAFLFEFFAIGRTPNFLMFRRYKKREFTFLSKIAVYWYLKTTFFWPSKNCLYQAQIGLFSYCITAFRPFCPERGFSCLWLLIHQATIRDIMYISHIAFQITHCLFSNIGNSTECVSTCSIRSIITRVKTQVRSQLKLSPVNQSLVWYETVLVSIRLSAWLFVIRCCCCSGPDCSKGW